MRILLMRHAEASHGFPDSERPLSAYGVQSLSDRPLGLSSQLQSVTDVLVSPYLRTRQTIEGLLPGVSYAQSPLLTPDCSPDPVLDQLADYHQDACVLLVTHMPLVGTLMSRLVDGQRGQAYGFSPAQIAVLECDVPAAGLATHVNTFSLNA